MSLVDLSSPAEREDRDCQRLGATLSILIPTVPQPFFTKTWRNFQRFCQAGLWDVSMSLIVLFACLDVVAQQGALSPAKRASQEKFPFPEQSVASAVTLNPVAYFITMNWLSGPSGTA